MDIKTSIYRGSGGGERVSNDINITPKDMERHVFTMRNICCTAGGGYLMFSVLRFYKGKSGGRRRICGN